jgi:hypothetical protein
MLMVFNIPGFHPLQTLVGTCEPAAGSSSRRINGGRRRNREQVILNPVPSSNALVRLTYFT